MECQRSNDGRKLDAQAKEALRIRSVEQILGSEAPETMAQVLGVNQRSISGGSSATTMAAGKRFGTGPNPGVRPN